MEEEELKRRAFERCVESSRPLPPLAVKGGDFIDDDDDNLAALKEREDAEKAGEYLERLMMMKEDDFDGKKKARRCAEMLGPVDAFGREMPFKLEFYMILLLEEVEELGVVEKLTRLARKCEVQLGASSASASASTSIWKQRRNEVLFAIVNARAKRNEYRAALSVCGRIGATNGVEGDARTEHAARSTALRILVASGDVGKAHAMLETIDETSIGRDAMLMNRVLLSTASGEYENALRLLRLQGGEGVDDAAACAKKICECALLVLKAQPKIALKGMLDAFANHPSHYLSTKNEDVGIVALTNICACYDISPSDASAKMAFFRFVKSNCGANENIGNFILKKQQQQQQQIVAANY